ncbi:MAG: pilus assembly protein [Deltaproteobacteria bacterium]|nr:pilus assembly protein [Deltaproteobacteria bacterium]
MKRKPGRSQRGSLAVMMAIALPVILGFVGLALDVGNLVLTKTKFRSAVDAALRAGAMKLPDQAAATTAATNFLAANGFPDITPAITFSQDAARNPTNFPEINITATKNVNTDFLGLLSAGFKTIALSVTAEAVNPVSTLQRPFTYLLFSNRDLALNGSQHTQGSIHSNNDVSVRGSQVLGGNVEGATSVTMRGSEHVTGYVQSDILAHIRIIGSEQIDGGLRAGATNIPFPDFTQEIIDATATADKYTSARAPDDDWDGHTFTYHGTTPHGGTIYVEGDVVISGSVNWTGTILAVGGNISITGSGQIQGANQVFLYAVPVAMPVPEGDCCGGGRGGNITIAGSTDFGSSTANCIAYAPGFPTTNNGCCGGGNMCCDKPKGGNISVQGNHDWYGRLVADTITIGGTGNFIGSYVNEFQALPYGVNAGPVKPQIIL